MKNNGHIPAFLTTRSLRAAAVYAMLFFAAAISANAQTTRPEPRFARPDTVTRDGSGGEPQEEEADTTEYESIRSTPLEQAALIGANAILVPIALTAVVLSVMPPSLGVVVDHGVTYASVAFETGVGIGEKKETGRYADERLILNYTHVYNPHRHDLWRIEAAKDVNLFTVDSRNLMEFGVSPLIGVYTDGPARGYSIGSAVRLMLPSLPYVGMFPLHTLGLTYRYNKTFGGGDFHTIAFGFSAAVIF